MKVRGRLSTDPADVICRVDVSPDAIAYVCCGLDGTIYLRWEGKIASPGVQRLYTPQVLEAARQFCQQ